MKATMRRLRWLTLVWPGLPQLWFAGAWTGLALAVGFAALLDLGLVVGRMWTELLSTAAQSTIWLAVGVTWLAAAGVSFRWVASLKLAGTAATESTDADEGLFNQARSEYLQGNWYEAETALKELLERNILDAEARLMLAALLRRSGRLAEAAEQLDRLKRMDGAERWQLEIHRQGLRLAEKVKESSTASNSLETAAAADSQTISHAA